MLHKHLRRKRGTFEEKTKEAISYGEPRVKESAQFHTTFKKDTIFQIFSILQHQKIPERIRLGLENHFLPNWKQQKQIFLNRKPLKKRKIGTFFEIFRKNF